MLLLIVSNISVGKQNRFLHREIVIGVSNISEGRQNRFSHQDATLPPGLRKDVPRPPHLTATSVFPSSFLRANASSFHFSPKSSSGLPALLMFPHQAPSSLIPWKRMRRCSCTCGKSWKPASSPEKSPVIGFSILATAGRGLGLVEPLVGDQLPVLKAVVGR